MVCIKPDASLKVSFQVLSLSNFIFHFSILSTKLSSSHDCVGLPLNGVGSKSKKLSIKSWGNFSSIDILYGTAGFFSALLHGSFVLSSTSFE